MLEEGLDVVKVPINRNLSRRGKHPKSHATFQQSAHLSPLYTFSPFRSKGRLLPTPPFSEMTQSGIPSTDSIPGIGQESARIRHPCLRPDGKAEFP